MIIPVRIRNLSFWKRAKTNSYDNERLGNCIIIVAQVRAVGNSRHLKEEI